MGVQSNVLCKGKSGSLMEYYHAQWVQGGSPDIRRIKISTIGRGKGAIFIKFDKTRNPGY